MVEEVDSIALHEASEADAQRMIDEINWVMTNNGQESVSQLREELQQSMTDNAGVFRTAETLQTQMGILQDLRNRYKNIRISDNSKIFNTELQEAIEFGHMLDYSLFIVASALDRKESRGAHFREDFPTRDDENFLKHTMAYMDAEGNITLDYMDVTLGRHEVKARSY
jgi:succinate dehydrogenase / fumarate reductase flavoprotein subunit